MKKLFSRKKAKDVPFGSEVPTNCLLSLQPCLWFQVRSMEGIPRVLMLTPDVKVPEAPGWQAQAGRVRQYIYSHYQSGKGFDDAFIELDRLRNVSKPVRLGIV